MASVTLQDPDKRPVRGKTVRGTVLARLKPKRCQRGVHGHVNLFIAPCLKTGHSGPHKRRRRLNLVYHTQQTAANSVD